VTHFGNTGKVVPVLVYAPLHKGLGERGGGAPGMFNLDINAASPLAKESRTKIVQETGWEPDQVWKMWRSEKSPAHAGK
jgi:hypothetical protein